MSNPVSQQVFYSGRVQGVGFRYTVKRSAAGFEVVGWVRNLPDGRVELQVSGEAPEVESFLENIAQGPLAAHIKHVERAPLTTEPKKWHNFEIRA